MPIETRTVTDNQPGQFDDDQWRPLIDPMKVFGGIYRSRYVIAATTVAGAALGVMIALQTPNKYYSASEMLVDPRDIKVVDREVTQGGLPSDATLAIVQNQVRVLTSGRVLQRAVDKLKLDSDPEFNGEKRSFGIGTIISEIRSLLSRKDGEAGNNRRALAIQNLAQSMSVERGDKTFVVSVGVETQDPKKSALIANTLTEIFLEASGDIQSATAGRANDELTNRLAELQSGLEEAERKVEAYRAEHDLVDAKGGLISDEEILKLNDQLGTARARTIDLNARAASARNVDVNSVVTGDLPEQMSSAVLAELRSQYTSAKREVDSLSVRLGPRHPQRLAAEAQRDGLRDSINLELRRIVSSVQVELKRAVEAEQALASRLAQLKSRQGVVGEDLVALRELERDAASKRAVYESFLIRARETGEQRSLNTANITVISEAQPAMLPLGPSRSVRVIMAAIAGFMLGVAFGVMRGIWDSLRDAGAVGGQRRRSRPKGQTDDIDRIMTGAANSWASQEASIVEAETAPETKSPKDTPVYPPYSNPTHPHQPSPEQVWHMQQAAWHEAQQRAAHQAWQAAQQVPVYPPMQAAPQPSVMAQPVAQPYWPAYPQAAYPVAPYPQQPGFTQPGYGPPPQPAYQSQAWAPPAQPAPPPAYMHPAYAPQPQPPHQTQAWAPASPEQPGARSQSTMDEIRESLREFRAAVSDLAHARSRAAR